MVLAFLYTANRALSHISLVKLHQHSEYQQQILGRAFLSSIHADFLTRHCHFNKRNGCIFHQGDQGDRKGRLNSVMASYCICTDDMNKPLKLPNCSGVDVLKHLSNLERCSLEYRIVRCLQTCKWQKCTYCEVVYDFR